MNILITGASGFLGKYVRRTFLDNSFSVLTIGRKSTSDIIVDLSTKIPDLKCFQGIKRIIHVAGKAHETKGLKANDLDYYNVNYLGTVNLCSALEQLKVLPDQIVFVSSVAVYGVDSGILINEKYPLNGKTPYAISKKKAEKYLLEWGEKYNVKVLILRLPLVIGKGAPGSLQKMIRGIKSGLYLRIGDGLVQKSMVLAQDVADLILRSTDASGIFNLAGRNHPTLRDLETVIMKYYKVKFIFSLPLGLVKTVAKMGDFFTFFPLNSKVFDKLTYSLTFDDQKAIIELKWNPNCVLDSNF
jgi:nucleoside-diphosphate-sugar epimerase